MIAIHPKATHGDLARQQAHSYRAGVFQVERHDGQHAWAFVSPEEPSNTLHHVWEELLYPSQHVHQPRLPALQREEARPHPQHDHGAVPALAPWRVGITHRRSQVAEGSKWWKNGQDRAKMQIMWLWGCLVVVVVMVVQSGHHGYEKIK